MQGNHSPAHPVSSAPRGSRKALRTSFRRRGWLGLQLRPREFSFSSYFQPRHLCLRSLCWYRDSQTLVSKLRASGPRRRCCGGHGAHSLHLCAPLSANLLAAPLPLPFDPAPLRPEAEGGKREASPRHSYPYFCLGWFCCFITCFISTLPALSRPLWSRTCSLGFFLLAPANCKFESGERLSKPCPLKLRLQLGLEPLGGG